MNPKNTLQPRTKTNGHGLCALPRRQRCLLATLVVLLTVNAQLSRVIAQGSEFTYNGLLNENGNPLNGMVELEATLWDAATNGNQILSVHTLRQMVEVKKGLFTVVLDFGKEAFFGSPRWLQFAVRKDPDPTPFTTLWPRQKITATPYAMTAEVLTGKVPIGGLVGAYSNVVAFDNPGNSFAGRGFDLTDLNASQLTSGTVPTAALGNAWKIGGNMGTTPGTHFLGTTDNQPLELKVNSQRALRLEPNPDSPNVIGGFNGNLVWAGDFGSTIGGGGSLNNPNAIYASYATIAGGRNNNIFASDYSAIGGGLGNWIRSFAATIAGGVGNRIGTNSHYSAIGGGTNNNIAANAQYATIPGGDSNFATNRAFAAGTRAKANHAGAFVWADSTDADCASSGANQFLIRASGGVGINLTNPVHMLHVGTSLGTNAINVSTHRAVVENSAEDGRAALLVLAGPGSTTATNRVELELEANEAQRRAIIGTASNHEIQFRQNNLVRMLLATDGNLYVAGTINGTLASNAVASTQIVDGSVSAADVNAPTFSTTFWKTDGNAGTTPGTHFLGTTDNRPLEFKVNGLRALRLEDNGDSGDSDTAPDGAPNLIGGARNNFVAPGVVGATISGGGAANYDGFARPNGVRGEFATIGGGLGNGIGTTASFSTIAGGFLNEIGTNSQDSAIGGGWGNDIAANSPDATIAGGIVNTIGANSYSSAIGGGGDNNIAAHSQFSIIAGGRFNGIASDSFSSAIGGGLNNDIGANSFYATIAGGVGNDIGTNSHRSAIGGGEDNDIGDNSSSSAIGGGYGNKIVQADYATIPGGFANTAIGNYSFAAGRRAHAQAQGTFVWADSQNADYGGGVPDSVSFRCQGGVTFTSGSGETVHWLPGFLNWAISSDRNLKDRVTEVDSREVLEKVSRLPMSEWNYKDHTQRHIGPMAQDFHELFPLNDNDRMIDSGDLQGVTLVAIQGLNQKLEEQLQARDSEIRDLRQSLAELKETLKKLTTKTQE